MSEAAVKIEIHEPAFIRRFELADLSKHGPWLMKRFLAKFPEMGEKQIAGYLNGMITNNEHIFLYQDHAVALAQVSMLQWQSDLNAVQAVPGVNNDAALSWDGRVIRMLRRSGTPLLSQENLNKGLTPNNAPSQNAVSADAGMQVVAWTVRDGTSQRMKPSGMGLNTNGAMGAGGVTGCEGRSL